MAGEVFKLGEGKNTLSNGDAVEGDSAPRDFLSKSAFNHTAEALAIQKQQAYPKTQ